MLDRTSSDKLLAIYHYHLSVFHHSKWEIYSHAHFLFFIFLVSLRQITSPTHTYVYKYKSLRVVHTYTNKLDEPFIVFYMCRRYNIEWWIRNRLYMYVCDWRPTSGGQGTPTCAWSFSGIVSVYVSSFCLSAWLSRNSSITTCCCYCWCLFFLFVECVCMFIERIRKRNHSMIVWLREGKKREREKEKRRRDKKEKVNAVHSLKKKYLQRRM